MIVKYNKLWKKLIDNNMTKTELRKKAGISTNVLAKMGKEESVSLESLWKISLVFDCGIDELIEIKGE